MDGCIKQPGFFDVEERLSRLSRLGGQLEAFSRTVDFKAFRPDLDKALAYADGSKGGRPPFDPVLMFKILVIQTLKFTKAKRQEDGTLPATDVAIPFFGYKSHVPSIESFA